VYNKHDESVNEPKGETKVKTNRPQTEFTTLEHMSFTISQISQDILGNQVVERTY